MPTPDSSRQRSTSIIYNKNSLGRKIGTYLDWTIVLLLYIQCYFYYKRKISMLYFLGSLKVLSLIFGDGILIKWFDIFVVKKRILLHWALSAHLSFYLCLHIKKIKIHKEQQATEFLEIWGSNKNPFNKHQAWQGTIVGMREHCRVQQVLTRRMPQGLYVQKSFITGGDYCIVR